MDLKSYCSGPLNAISIDNIIHTPANFNQSTENWRRFIQATCTFFYKQLGSGLSPQVAHNFEVFRAQSCLMVA